MNPIIADRIVEFREDIKRRNVLDIVQRYITSGVCFALEERLYIELKQRIAAQYGVHHTQVVVVGSAKLGFSIAPDKRYRAFCETSDIDVAFSNDRLFDSIWFEVFKYYDQGERWEGLEDFRNYLFLGWIRPDKLPPSKYFPLAGDWWEFFRRQTATGDFGPYKIRGALYKSMDFLEAYQQRCVKECKIYEAGNL